MPNYSHDFAEWVQSWATRLENAYLKGVDLEGYPRFLEALKHYDETGKFTPGQMAYFINRDKDLGLGKLKGYNTHRGFNKEFGNILPVPVKAVILGGFIDWSIQYQSLRNLTDRLEVAEPGWEYNYTSGCWQGKNPAVKSNLVDIFK